MKISNILIITFLLIASIHFNAEAKTNLSININSLLPPPPMRAYEGYIVERYRPIYPNESRYLRAGTPYEPEIIYIVPQRPQRVIVYPTCRPRAGFFFSW